MEALLAHCTKAFSGQESFYLAFFLGGLTGGFTHCLAMCGPLAACDRLCAGSCKSKSNGIAYHLGRLTTYSSLGFLAALLGRQLSAFSWWPDFSAAMLASAGVLFLLTCAGKITLGKMTFSRGMMLGFMPCGLLYAALMMAATLSNPWQGMLAMALFALGTLPALLIAHLGVEFFSRKWRHAMQQAGHFLMAFNGLSLLVMAARIMR